MSTYTTPMLLASIALVLITYLIINVVVYLMSLYRRSKAVLQWPGPPRHWFWGTMHHQPIFDPEFTASGILDKQLDYLIDTVTEFPFGRYEFNFFRPQLMCIHPDQVRPILKRSDGKPLGFGDVSQNFIYPWLGDGLLLAKGKKWFRNRRLLTPAFHFDILKPYMEIYNKEVDVLLNKMDTFTSVGHSFEVCKHISLCTLDILLKCAFTQDSQCQTKGHNDPYVKAVQDLSTATVERFRHPHHAFDFIYRMSAEGRKFFKLCDYVHQVADDVISTRRKEIDQSTTKTNRKYLDFLDILLSARDDEGASLTDIEIRNEVDTFLFEGHDTTASALTWMLYSFAKHPEIQTKAQEEIDSLMNTKESNHIEWDDLSHMKYLTLCIKESLRMYPPVVVTMRQMESDIEIQNRVIPAGTQITLFIWSLHHNPEVWENHMEFIPERFLPENIQKRDPFAYVPFAAGPRNCIGQTFAMNEIKVILSRILRRFDLTLDPDHEVHFAQELLLKPAGDIKLILKQRNKGD